MKSPGYRLLFVGKIMDLREFYITPSYLKLMLGRARQWSGTFIHTQIEQFRQTIPDYPEVVELLEGELHRRRLNDLRRRLRRMRPDELEQELTSLRRAYLEKELSRDELEVIETEWRIRTGKKLPEDYEPGVK